MRSECDRTRLIAELASLLRECSMPDDARCAGLTLIGWLARRMPGEAPSTDGVEHAREQMEACARSGLRGSLSLVESRLVESRLVESSLVESNLSVTVVGSREEPRTTVVDTHQVTRTVAVRSVATAAPSHLPRIAKPDLRDEDAVPASGSTMPGDASQASRSSA